jgi:cell division septation protein DedD
MNYRPVALVVALVVLAGCGAVPFGGDSPATPRETLTPVPVPATTDQSRTDTPVDRPPGVDGARLDVVRLRGAHESALTSESYIWDLDYDVREHSRTETMFNEGFQRRVFVQRDRFLVEQVEDGRALEQSLFVDDSGGYLRVVQDNETERNALPDPGELGDYELGGQLVERFLTGMSPNVTRVQRDGQTYYRLYDESWIPATLERLATDVQNYRVTAYVTPEGFVRSMVVRYERTWDSGGETVSIRFDYSAVGETTVERPEWVSGLSVPTPTPEPSEQVTTQRPPAGTPTATGTATATRTAAVPTTTPTPTVTNVTVANATATESSTADETPD